MYIDHCCELSNAGYLSASSLHCIVWQDFVLCSIQCTVWLSRNMKCALCMAEHAHCTLLCLMYFCSSVQCGSVQCAGGSVQCAGETVCSVVVCSVVVCTVRCAVCSV